MTTKIETILNQLQTGQLKLIAEHADDGATALVPGVTDPLNLIHLVPLPSVADVELALHNVAAETEADEILCAIGNCIWRGLYRVVSDDCPKTAVDDVVIDVVEAFQEATTTPA